MPSRTSRLRVIFYVLLILVIFTVSPISQITTLLPQRQVNSATVTLPSPSQRVLPPKSMSWYNPASWYDLPEFFHDFMRWIIQSGYHSFSLFWSQTSRSLWEAFSNNLIPQVHATSIAFDTECSNSGASASTVSCNLNHAANTVVIVSPTINNLSNNSGTVSGVTIGGFAAILMVGVGSSTSLQFYGYWLFMPYAANDSVVVTYATYTNNVEAMVATSWTGTRTAFPVFNSRVSGAATSGTSDSRTPIAGEANRLLIDTIGINSNASITPGGSQTECTSCQINVTGASVEVNSRATGSSVAMTGSWTGTIGHGGIAFALLPSGQIVTDANATGVMASGTGSFTGTTSGTITSFAISNGSVCMVAVGILNASSQTVSSVVGATIGTFIKLTAIPNSTNISTDIWYLPSLGSTSTGTITVTVSANASVVMAAACFDGAKQLQLFENQATGTGNSGTASATVNAGTTSRRIILAAAFATAATPVGSQGFDVTGVNANSIGIDLNVLDASTQNTMSATATSSQWAAIGVALLPFVISVDATCSSSSASATTTSCSLNHAANTLVTIWIADTGTDTASSVTVAGSAATLFGPYSSTDYVAVYLYYASSAGNDSVVATWTAHNTNQSLVAVSWLNTRSSVPFANSLNSFSNTSVTQTTVTPTPGEFNSVEVSGSGVNTASVFDSSQTVAHPQYDVAQVNGNSNALGVAAANTPMTGHTVNFSSSSTVVSVAIRILPSNQVVVDGRTDTGANVKCTNTASSTSITCALPAHDANVLVTVVVILLPSGTPAQTVSTVKIGSQAFAQLITIANGTSVSTDVWWWYDTNSGAETITVTPSASVAMNVLAVAFANVPSTCTSTASTCFDIVSGSNPYATATGSSATASVAEIAGVTNRRMVQAVGVGTSEAVTQSQGTLPANTNGQGLGSGFITFEPADSNAFTLSATFTSATWATIGLAILVATARAAQTVTATVTGDTLAFTLNPNRVLTEPRSNADSLSFTLNDTRVSGYVRSIIQNEGSYSLSGSLIQTLQRSGTATAVYTMEPQRSESAQRTGTFPANFTFTPSGLESLFRSSQDALAFTLSPTHVSEYSRTLTQNETFSFTGNIIQSLSRGSSFSATLTLLASHADTFVRTNQDAFTFSFSPTQCMSAYSRSLTQNEGFSFTGSMVQTLSRGTSFSATFAFNPTHTSQYSRSLTQDESFSFTGSIIQSLSRGATFSATFGFSPTHVSAYSRSVSQDEPFSFTGNIIQSLSRGASFSATLTLLASHADTFVRTNQDAFTFSFSPTRMSAYSRSLSQDEVFSFTGSIIQNLSRWVSLNLSYVFYVGNAPRTVTATVTGDTLAFTLNPNRVLTEPRSNAGGLSFILNDVRVSGYVRSVSQNEGSYSLSGSLIQTLQRLGIVTANFTLNPTHVSVYSRSVSQDEVFSFTGSIIQNLSRGASLNVTYALIADHLKSLSRTTSASFMIILNPDRILQLSRTVLNQMILTSNTDRLINSVRGLSESLAFLFAPSSFPPGATTTATTGGNGPVVPVTVLPTFNLFGGASNPHSLYTLPPKVTESWDITLSTQGLAQNVVLYYWIEDSASPPCDPISDSACKVIASGNMTLLIPINPVNNTSNSKTVTVVLPIPRSGTYVFYAKAHSVDNPNRTFMASQQFTVSPADYYGPPLTLIAVGILFSLAALMIVLELRSKKKEANERRITSSTFRQ